MHWFSIVIIGISANIDNLGIGVTYGTRSTRVPLLSNIVIALLSMTATYLAMSAGSYFSQLFSAFYGNLMGGLAIILLGIWGIRSSLIRRMNLAIDTKLDDKQSTPDGDHIILWAESISLGFALSINSFASSFGAGASGVSPILTAISVGLFSLLSVDLGIRLGSRIAKTWFGKYSDMMGCFLLIIIGCYEIIF